MAESVLKTGTNLKLFMVKFEFSWVWVCLRLWDNTLSTLFSDVLLFSYKLKILKSGQQKGENKSLEQNWELNIDKCCYKCNWKINSYLCYLTE